MGRGIPVRIELYKWVSPAKSYKEQFLTNRAANAKTWGKNEFPHWETERKLVFQVKVRNVLQVTVRGLDSRRAPRVIPVNKALLGSRGHLRVTQSWADQTHFCMWVSPGQPPVPQHSLQTLWAHMWINEATPGPPSSKKEVEDVASFHSS